MCVYGRGGGCVCAEGRVLPPHGVQRDRVGKGAVRVLMECLLVKIHVFMSLLFVYM